MKRIISLLLVLMMVLTIAPEFPELFVLETTAEAALAGTTSDGYEYEVSDAGEVTITGYSGSATDLVIPESIEGKTVKAIGDRAFFECTGITDIKIPDTVTSIGDRAFYNCSGLTGITIPDGVISIDDATFIYCTSLKSITFPKNLTSIGDRVFENCISLTNVILPESITSIGDGAFRHCASLTSITIPKSVTNIGYATFDSCNNLENVTLEEGLVTLGESMFSSCASLTSITIPGSVTRISDYAFYCCENLSSVTIEDGVSEIGIFTFFWSEKLTSISIPKSVTLIDAAAFYFSENITDVYYSGTEEQWSKIDIKEQNEPLLKATIHKSETAEEDNKETENVEESSSPVLGDNEAPFDDIPETTDTPKIPDMTVTDISWTPVLPKAGDLVTFTATIKNQGTAATPEGILTGVVFYVDGAMVSWSSNYNSSIKPGESITLTADDGVDGSAVWNAKVGTHIVKALVNDTNAYPESDTENNQYVVDIYAASSSVLGDNEAPFDDIPESTEQPTEAPTQKPTEDETTEAYNGVIRIEAEDYDDMSGVALRGTQDQDSDVISSVDAGDYMIYTVNIPESATFRFNARAARSDSGISILSLMENDSVIASCDIRQTGSWSSFSEFEGTEVYLEAGTHTFKVYAKGGRYNLNWYELVEVEETTEDVDSTILIEAEDYDDMSGVALRGTQEQGSDVISSVDAGDYMIYTVNVPVSGTYIFNVRAARSDAGISILSLMENDSVIATCGIGQTGSWTTFDEFEGTEVYLEAGAHTFKVYANGGRYNLNWYKFAIKTESDEELPEAPSEEVLPDGSVLIEAENYDTMSGVALRDTQDQDSDVISSVDAGDYMIYEVNIPASGNYRFDVRAARSDSGLSVLSLMENNSTIATVNITSTGGWGTFAEFEGTECYLEAGTHTFKVYAKGGRYNLNWYTLVHVEKEVTSDGSILIEAEEYDSMSGVALRGTLEQGSDVISSVDAGDYMIYTVEVPTSGTYRFDVRAARSDSGTSLLNLMENDSVIASCGISQTGGWSTFSDFEGSEIYLTAGTHTFKVYAKGGRYNLNWYKLTSIALDEAE